jgi:integrase/recombinase XerD
LGGGIRRLLLFADIRKPDGRTPRVHDFRHSFAVNALLRWYHAGIDVETRLPYLAAYMGHVSIVSTQYYLHFIEPLRTLASQRFAQHYGQLITSGDKAERIRS